MRVILFAPILLIAAVFASFAQATGEADQKVIAEVRELIATGEISVAAKKIKPLSDAGLPEANYLLGTLIEDHELPGYERKDAILLYLSSLENGYPGAFYRISIPYVWYNERYGTQDVIDYIIPEAKDLPKKEFDEVVTQVSGRKIFTTVALLLSAEQGDTRAIQDQAETFRNLTEDETKKSNELFQKWRKRADLDWKELIGYYFNLGAGNDGATPPQ